MEIEKRKKTPHTYRERCRKYFPGATKLEMEHAARGGEVGRKKLLERLGIKEDKRAPVQGGPDQNRKERDKAEDQRTPVLRGRDQKRKEREKTVVREQNAAARMSSLTTKEERPPLKVGNKKKSKEAAPQSPMEEESSPDMVAVILGEAEERRPRQGKQKEERTTTSPPARSGTQESAPPVQTRVPPSESARVSAELLRQRNEEIRQREQRIEWQNWENAAKKYLKTRRQLQEREEARVREEVNKKEENKDDREIAKPKEAEKERMAEQPLTPLLPREESPIGDQSTTEQMEDDKAEQWALQSPTSQAWHRNTRPAEPKIPKQRKWEEPAPRLEGERASIRLEQLAYLAMWMKEDDETRYFWEGRQPDQEADFARLAREMQKTDPQLGQGATARCIASKLTEWGYEEPLGAPSQEAAPETTEVEAHRSQWGHHAAGNSLHKMEETWLTETLTIQHVICTAQVQGKRGV